MVSLTPDQRRNLVKYLVLYGEIDLIVHRRHFFDNIGLSDYAPELVAKIQLEGSTNDFAQEVIRVLERHGVLKQTEQLP